MKRFGEMTQEGKEFIVHLLNERLSFWKERGECTIKASDNDIEICSEKQMHGSIIVDIAKIVEMFDLTSYAYCEMCQIRIRMF